MRHEPLQAGLHWIVPLWKGCKCTPIATQTYTMASARPARARSRADHRRGPHRTTVSSVRRLVCHLQDRSHASDRIHNTWQSRYQDDLIRRRCAASSATRFHNSVWRSWLAQNVSTLTAHDHTRADRCDGEQRTDPGLTSCCATSLSPRNMPNPSSKTDRRTAGLASQAFVVDFKETGSRTGPPDRPRSGGRGRDRSEGRGGSTDHPGKCAGGSQ